MQKTAACVLITPKGEMKMTKIYDFEFVEGIAFVSQGERIKLAFSRNLVFLNKQLKDVMSVEYADITNAEVLTETTEENKSVIGRAVVGGLLLGPVGAVVGGISGTGKKEKNNYYLRITYSNGNEEKTVILKSFDKTQKTCENAKNLIVAKKNGDTNENIAKEEAKIMIKCECGEEFEYNAGNTICPKCGRKNPVPKEIKIAWGVLAILFLFIILLANSCDGDTDKNKTTETAKAPVAKQEVVQTENPVLTANTNFVKGLASILNAPYKIVNPQKVYYTKSKNFKEVYFFGTVVEANGQYYNAMWATNNMEICGGGLLFSENDYAINASGMGDGRTNADPITSSDDGYSRINTKLIQDMSDLI